MKKIYLTILGLFLALSVSAQESETAYANFYKDSTYYLIGDQVNVRLNPDTAGKISQQLPIGERVTVLENTGIPYTKNGYTTNWYRVRYNHQGNKAEGYVWGGMLASKTSTSMVDKELQYMYAVNKVVKTEYYDEVYLQLRVCKNKKQLAKLDLRSVGGLRTYNTAESIGPKGVPGVVDIFTINFSDGYCAGSFGDAYFFWDGNKIYHAKTLDEGFDAPYFGRNKFIFPDESKNKKGYIINKSESGFYGDDDKEHIEEWEKITYTWDGSKLVVVKKEKKK